MDEDFDMSDEEIFEDEEDLSEEEFVEGYWTCPNGYDCNDCDHYIPTFDQNVSVCELDFLWKE